MAGHSSLPCADYVNLPAIPAIHVFLRSQSDSETWKSGARPGMTENIYPAATLASAGMVASSACSVARVD
jgi:hypothetical protein